MTCFHPDFIRSLSGKLIQVPCGKCYGCLKSKRQQIAYRIEQDYKLSKSSFFITLTYSDEYLERFLRSPEGVLYSMPSVNPTTHTLFMKRFRKYLPQFKFYMSAEYGDCSKRPHYHYLIWTDSEISKDSVSNALSKSWKYGLFEIGDVTPASINYVAKHQVKRCLGMSSQAPNFHRSSKGIGKGWLTETNINYFLENPEKRIIQITDQKHKIPLPRYLREKIQDYCLLKAYFPDMSLSYILSLNQRQVLELTSDKLVQDYDMLDKYMFLKNLGDNDNVRSNKEYTAYRVAYNKWLHSSNSIGKTETDFIHLYYSRLNKNFIDSFKYFEQMYFKLSNHSQI